MIGGAYRDIFDYQIVNGNYNNVVEVGVGATPGMDPALAEDYSCSLLVGLRGRPSFVQTAQIEPLMKPDGIYPRDTTKPFRVSVSGKIPKQAVKPSDKFTPANMPPGKAH